MLASKPKTFQPTWRLSGMHFLFGAPTDPRLPPKARMLGLLVGNKSAAVAYPVGPGRPRVMEVRLGGRRLVVLLSYGIGQPGTARSFAQSTRGWAGVAFLPRVLGRTVALTPRPGGFVDRRTGSMFDLTGRAVSGPLAGGTLSRVPSVDALWFAWSRFYPQSRVIEVSPV